MYFLLRQKYEKYASQQSSVSDCLMFDELQIDIFLFFAPFCNKTSNKLLCVVVTLN